MDTKRLLIGMAVAMLLVIGWAKLVQYLHSKHPEWAKAAAGGSSWPRDETLQGSCQTGF